MIQGEDYTGISIVFFCHDGNGNFLMQKRGLSCRDERGNWDVGSGALDFGDSVEDTLRREIGEEYSCEVLDYESLGYRDVHRKDDFGKLNHWIALDFKVLVDKEQVANGEPYKFDEIGWFRLDDLPSPVHSQFPDFIARYRDRISK